MHRSVIAYLKKFFKNNMNDGGRGRQNFIGRFNEEIPATSPTTARCLT
jgi:hypothetical protein